MTASPIVVGKLIVDPAHADLAQSLLFVQDALADIEANQIKGKGKARPSVVGIDHDEDLTDEEYAIKVQEAQLQDILRTMEDYRLAKSLAEGDITDGLSPYTIVDQAAIDYLKALLPTSSDAITKKTPHMLIDTPCSISNIFSDSGDIFSDGDIHSDPLLDTSEGLYTPSPSGTPTDLQNDDDPVQKSDMFSVHIAAKHREALLNVLARTGQAAPSSVAHAGNPAIIKLNLCVPIPSPDAQDSSQGDATKAAAKTDGTRASSPPPDLTNVFGEQFGFRTIYCMACGDLVVGEPTLRAPCGHDICVDCVQDLVTSAIRDESLFPPHCCRQPFPQESMNSFLTLKLQSDFDTKRLEFGTPAGQRIFCPKDTCSAFIGSSEAADKDVSCPSCATVVCPLCKMLAHPGETCSENTLTASVRKLAEENLWQTCPQCHAIVERTQGCNHMTCRCSSNFCYVCGKQMGQCSH